MKNSSDTYLTNSTTPGADTLEFIREANNHNVKYKIATLQMLGYVSADKNGIVSSSEKVPSKRWCKVEFRKKGSLSLTPDLTDGVVYMDEYLNYLIKKLGDSTTSTGIQGYSLDNEPAFGTVSSDNSKVCSFAAKDNSDKTLNIILTNNNMNEDVKINIELKKNNKKYKKVTIYGITSESSEIVEIDSSKLRKINNNKYTIEMPPVSAYRIVLEK